MRRKWFSTYFNKKWNNTSSLLIKFLKNITAKPLYDSDFFQNTDKKQIYVFHVYKLLPNVHTYRIW